MPGNEVLSRIFDRFLAFFSPRKLDVLLEAEVELEGAL